MHSSIKPQEISKGDNRNNAYRHIQYFPNTTRKEVISLKLSVENITAIRIQTACNKKTKPAH